MATWYSLPSEVHNIILKYILANRAISRTCPLLSCLVCFAPDRKSDFLSLRLVSKDFVDISEASRVLFSSAKLSVHHAVHLKTITTSNFPYQRIRHLELPEDCDPIRSKIAFSMQGLKTIFPDIKSITIRTTYPLHYGMDADEPIYTHAYCALRISKAEKGHFCLAQYTTWPVPSQDDLAAARNRDMLIFKPSNSSPSAGQNILAASLDAYTTTGPHVEVNPYLTAWHARLMHDAYLDPTRSVKVTMHAPIELRVYQPRYAHGVVHRVRDTTIDSTDMVLRFALNSTEIQIPQVLNQTWFDSRFRNARFQGWDYAVNMQSSVAKKRSESVHDSGEVERDRKMGIYDKEGNLITAKRRSESDDY